MIKEKNVLFLVLVLSLSLLGFEQSIFCMRDERSIRSDCQWDVNNKFSRRLQKPNSSILIEGRGLIVKITFETLKSYCFRVVY